MMTLPRLVAILVVLATAGIAWADLAPPPIRPIRPIVQPPAPADTRLPAVPLVIEVTDKAQEAKVQIPAALFRYRAELDNPNKDEQRAYAAAQPGMQTLMVGLSLALALSFGGLWLVRQRSIPAGRALALLLSTVAILAVGTAVVWANAAPPGLDPIRPAKAGMKGEPTDRIYVEIVGKNEGNIKLIINKDKLVKILEEANKKAEEKAKKSEEKAKK
jgi:hypothetical protein